jgi:hypothetical protein
MQHEVHYRDHNSLPLVPVINEMNPVHALQLFLQDLF